MWCLSTLSAVPLSLQGPAHSRGTCLVLDFPAAGRLRAQETNTDQQGLSSDALDSRAAQALCYVASRFKVEFWLKRFRVLLTDTSGRVWFFFAH